MFFISFSFKLGLFVVNDLLFSELEHNVNAIRTSNIKALKFRVSRTVIRQEVLTLLIVIWTKDRITKIKAISKFNSYVNKPRIEEEEIKNLIQNAKIHEYKLKNQIKLVDGKIFGHQKPQFEQINKFVDPSLIGHLIYENLIVANDLIDIDKIVKPKVEKQVEHFNVDMALPLISFDSVKEECLNHSLFEQEDKLLILSGYYLKIINECHTLVEITFDYPPDYVGVNR